MEEGGGNMTLCACGCGEDAGVYTAAGFEGLPRKFIHGHNLTHPIPGSGIKVILSKIEIFPGDGCIYWTGANGGRSKHGSVKHFGRNTKVHRVMYEHAIGPIPPGNIVHHTCETENCVNPSHFGLTLRGRHSTTHKLAYWGKEIHARIERAGGDPAIHKICSKCKELKTKDQFGKCAPRRDGLDGYCKNCQQIRRETKKEAA
jgi:hypothetical protein